jgi:hypothetical protein
LASIIPQRPARISPSIAWLKIAAHPLHHNAVILVETPVHGESTAWNQRIVMRVARITEQSKTFVPRELLLMETAEINPLLRDLVGQKPLPASTQGE